MNNMDWWQGMTINPTPRKMWNPKDWNFQFERGTFVRNSHLTALCDYEWDPSVILENSEITQKIISENNFAGVKTDVEKYETETWNYLHSLMMRLDNDR